MSTLKMIAAVVSADQSKPLKLLALLAAISLALSGCATSDADPRQARANTGYVDFHGEPPANLSWEIDRFDEHAREFRRIVLEVQPPPGGFLRLALAPGPHRLRVICINRVTTGPAELEVQVVDGKITPVSVKFNKAGANEVETESVNSGATLYGRYGRTTTFSDTEEARYRLSATAGTPVAYQLKSEMPYAH